MESYSSKFPDASSAAGSQDLVRTWSWCKTRRPGRGILGHFTTKIIHGIGGRGGGFLKRYTFSFPLLPPQSVHLCITGARSWKPNAKGHSFCVFFSLRRSSWKKCLPKLEQSLMHGLPNSISAHVKIFWLLADLILLDRPFFPVV